MRAGQGRRYVGAAGGGWQQSQAQVHCAGRLAGQPAVGNRLCSCFGGIFLHCVHICYLGMTGTSRRAVTRASTPPALVCLLVTEQEAGGAIRSSANCIHVCDAVNMQERDMCAAPAANNPFSWHLHRATLKQLVGGQQQHNPPQRQQQHEYVFSPNVLQMS